MSNQNNIVTSEEILALLDKHKEATFFMNLKQFNALISIPGIGVIVNKDNKNIVSPAAAQTILPKQCITILKNKSIKNKIPFSAFKDMGQELSDTIKHRVILNLHDDLGNITYTSNFIPSKKK